MGVGEQAGDHIKVVGDHRDALPRGEIGDHRLAGGPGIEEKHHPVFHRSRSKLRDGLLAWQLELRAELALPRGFLACPVGEANATLD
jgi:hypothetical protein